MRLDLRTLGRKNLLLLLGVFLVLTPLILLSFSKSFDSRSRASIANMPEKFKKADLNSKDGVTLEDFEIWVSHFVKASEQSSYYNKLADLDGDNKIGIGDFEVWLSLFTEYQTWKSSNSSSGNSSTSSSSGTTPSSSSSGSGSGTSAVKVTSLSSPKYLYILSVGEFVIPQMSITPSNASSDDLVYSVDKSNIAKLVDDKKKPNKWIVGVSQGDARITISSKSNPSVKIYYYIHVVSERAVALGINEKYDFNGYGVTEWKEVGAPGNIILTKGGVVTGKKRGVASIRGMSGNKELVKISIGVDLTVKPTYSLMPSTVAGKEYGGYMLKDTSGNRKVVDTNKAYTSYQKAFLENYLTQKIESVGGLGTRGGKNYKTLTGSKQGSRSGAVAAARFLALEFQYRIPYANGDWDGKVYTKGKHSSKNMLDFGGWIFSPSWYKSFEIQDLYGYKLNIYDANNNNTGKGCWGCSTGGKNYVIPSNGLTAFVDHHGLHCSSFVSWALYNGGLNIFHGMKSAKVLENIKYMVSQQPNAEYIVLADKDKKIRDVTEEQWKKVKVGDLIYYEGDALGFHVGMIIGIDHKNKFMYIAHQTTDSIIVDRVNYMRAQTSGFFAGRIWQKIILMDKVYGSTGYYSSMW